MVEELAEEAQVRDQLRDKEEDRAEDPEVLAALPNVFAPTVAMKSLISGVPHVRRRSVPNAEVD